MEKLNEKYSGESPKITTRMDPGMLKIVDKEAKRIGGNRSAALRSLVMRSTGAGVTAAVSAAATAQKELADAASAEGTLRRSLRAMEERAVKAESERDEAIAQRKAADSGAKKTMEAWAEARKELDAMINARNAVMLERDTLKSHLASVELERDELRAQLKQRDEEINAIRTAHRIIAEAPAEIVREAETPIAEPTDDTARNTSLRARWRALKQPLRAFVAKHGITRTPFQKWAAGERDMHGETLEKYEAAIRSEE